MTTVVVGISGCSGSGKTTLAEAVAGRLGRSRVVSLDDYYWPGSEDWEDPSSLNFEGLAEEVGWGDHNHFFCSLFWAQVRRLVRESRYRCVVVEGFCLFAGSPVLPLLQLRVLLDCPFPVARARRAARDGPLDADGYFEERVWPAHLSYLAKTEGVQLDAHLDANGELNENATRVVALVEEERARQDQAE